MLPWPVSRPARANGNLTHRLPAPAARLDFKQTAACRPAARARSLPLRPGAAPAAPTQGLEQAAQDLAGPWDHPTPSLRTPKVLRRISVAPRCERKLWGICHPSWPGGGGGRGGSSRSARARVASGPERWQCRERAQAARPSSWSSALALRSDLGLLFCPPPPPPLWQANAGAEAKQPGAYVTERRLPSGWGQR